MNTANPDSIARFADSLSDLMPDRPDGQSVNRAQVVDATINVAKKINAAEFAKLKYKERKKVRELTKEAEAAEAAGIDLKPGQSLKDAKELAESKAKLEALDELEAASVLDLNRYAQSAQPTQPAQSTRRTQSTQPTQPAQVQPAEVTVSNNAVNAALDLQGTTRPEIKKLLQSLNINLSVQLSKNDTANLLATLLTCNQTQLLALFGNPKVPVAIKIVIKRILDDVKIGNMEAIEKLWDRIFGKGPMKMDLPDAAQLRTGILPDTPVSREAYIVIRDTLIK